MQEECKENDMLRKAELDAGCVPCIPAGRVSVDSGTLSGYESYQVHALWDCSQADSMLNAR